MLKTLAVCKAGIIWIETPSNPSILASPLSTSQMNTNKAWCYVHASNTLMDNPHPGVVTQTQGSSPRCQCVVSSELVSVATPLPRGTGSSLSTGSTGSRRCQWKRSASVSVLKCGPEPQLVIQTLTTQSAGEEWRVTYIRLSYRLVERGLWSYILLLRTRIRHNVTPVKCCHRSVDRPGRGRLFGRGRLGASDGNARHSPISPASAYYTAAG